MTDYSTVTETGNAQLTADAVQMMYSRYRFAAGYAAGKRVLEVACGSGQGLGFLARVASEVVGGDCTPALVAEANEYYNGRVKVVEFDAHHMPFPDGSFDVVLLYEALYYLHDPAEFVREARRVLGPRGTLIICTANKDRPDFNSSPFSVGYHSVPELARLVAGGGFRVGMFGGFPVQTKGLRRRLIFVLRKIAIALNLIPKKMGGKALLKRIFYGKLHTVREVNDGMAAEELPIPIPVDLPDVTHSVVYAVGQLP